MKRPYNLRRPVLLLTFILFGGVALALGSPFLSARILGPGEPTLNLLSEDSNGVRYVAVGADTICSEPNLVIITHGWYEREPWPAEMAMAIYRRVDRRHWRCGWYDWRGRAACLLPSDAAKVARDEAGPSLGRRIVGLSDRWRHVHLIGHSAGSWLVNEAANVVASQTSAELHITLLDAYVPKGWDAGALGRLVGDPCSPRWVEHYFTRDRLGHLTENLLAKACNVDITDANPGFNGHKFPWHWYQATIAGGYDPNGRFARSEVHRKASGVRYGFERSLEAGVGNWRASIGLGAPKTPAKVLDSR